MVASAALVLLIASLPLTIGAAWSDMRSMILSNRMVLATLAVFVLVGPMVLPFGDYLFRLGVAAVILEVMIGLFALGAVRGGDAKYLTALIPYFAPGDLFQAAHLLGVVGLSAFITHRVFARIPAVRRMTPDWLSWRAKRHFPYGLVLAGSQIFYLFAKAIQ